MTEGIIILTLNYYFFFFWKLWENESLRRRKFGFSFKKAVKQKTFPNEDFSLFCLLLQQKYNNISKTSYSERDGSQKNYQFVQKRKPLFQIYIVNRFLSLFNLAILIIVYSYY